MSERPPLTKIQFEVGPSFPFLVRQAANKAGFEFSALWLRERLCRLLADELGEDYDELMAEMPVSWRDNPGAVIFKSADKPSEDVGQVG